MLHVLHCLGWSFLALFWTMLLMNIFLTQLFKPKKRDDHLWIDSNSFSTGLGCGLLVFVLLL